VFRKAFPTLSLEEDDLDIVEVVDFYLWDSNADLYNLFKLLLPYFGQYYALNTATNLLLELATSLDIPVLKAVKLIPYIHSGYSNILLEASNGK